jgi:hypothetical protein
MDILAPATPYDDGDMEEEETSSQAEATTTISAVPVETQTPAEAQASKPPRKRRFVEIFQKHQLDITQVAERAKVPNTSSTLCCSTCPSIAPMPR